MADVQELLHLATQVLNGLGDVAPLVEGVLRFIAKSCRYRKQRLYEQEIVQIIGTATIRTE